MWAYLKLMRPPNLLTAVADICLGFAASGALIKLNSQVLNYIPKDIQALGALPILSLASICLYGGGVVLNDVFDYELDKIERPERPLPSGKASLAGAKFLGFTLLLLGVIIAMRVSYLSMGIALVISILVLIYDALAKSHPFWGPLSMGLCRGANLALGMSIFPESFLASGFILLIPVVYIGAITLISRGEVNGGDKNSLNAALFLYFLVILSIPGLAFFSHFRGLDAFPFGIFFTILVLPPLFKARESLLAQDIFKAVKAGVLALIVLDASLAAGFAGWEFGLFVLLLLPLSRLLARVFAVT